VAIGKDGHSEICVGKEDSFHQRIGLGFKEQTNEMVHTERNLYGAETWTFRNIDQKYRESTAMCWRRMGKSVALIVCRMKSQGRKEHPTYNNMKRITGLVMSCIRAAFQNVLLKKDRRKERRDEKARRKT